MKKILGAPKRSENLFQMPFSAQKRGKFALEIGTVHAATLWAADFVHERKLECAVAIGGREQARSVYVVAEADGKLLIIEACAQNERIHQFALFQFVGNARPSTDLEGLVVAAAVAQEEFERVAQIDLERRPLEEGDEARNNADFLSNHFFAADVEREFTIERDVFLVAERLIGAVQVAKCAAEVEIGIVAQN